MERPLDPPEETIRPEPEFERDYTTVDEEFAKQVTDSIIELLPDIARGLK